MDYRELFDSYADRNDVLFVFDPPYLSTEPGHYNRYWHLVDFLDVIWLLKDYPFIFFTSDKSRVPELSKWMEDHKIFTNPFPYAKKFCREVKSRTMNYTDIMFFKG